MAIKFLPRPCVCSCFARLRSTAAAAAAATPESAGVRRAGVRSAGVEGEGVRGKKWSPQSRRSGAIAVKLGMTQLWNEEGLPMAVTVLQVCRGRGLDIRWVWF